MLHRVRINEKTLKAFKAFLNERKIEHKSVTDYINEETEKMEARAKIIKVLNCLDELMRSEQLDELQKDSYIKPAFEKILQLRGDMGR
jgi:hypothetical protein